MTRIGSSSAGRHTSYLPKLPHRHRPVIPPDRDLAERNGIAAVVAERATNHIGDQQLRIEFLVERFQPGRKVHGVPDDGIFLPAWRADIAGDHLAEMYADADPERPARSLVDALHRIEHFARGSDRAVRG